MGCTGTSSGYVSLSNALLWLSLLFHLVGSPVSGHTPTERWIPDLPEQQQHPQVKPNLCNFEVPIDEVFMGKDGVLYFILTYQGSQWISPGNQSHIVDACCDWPIPLKRMFAEQVDRLNAMVYYSPSKSYYLFNKRSIARYDNDGSFQQEFLHHHGQIWSVFVNIQENIVVVTKEKEAYYFDPWTLRFGEKVDLADSLGMDAPLDKVVSITEDYPYEENRKFIYLMERMRFWKIEARNRTLLHPSLNIRKHLFAC